VYLLFFPLISSTVAVYGLADKKKIILMVLLSFLFLGLLDLTDHQLFVLDLPLATLRLYYVCNFLLSLSFIIFCVSHLVVMNSRTQAVLRESEAKLSSVLDSLDEIVWAVSLPGYQVTYLNTAADRVLQFPDPSYRRDKRKWAQLVHPQDQKRYLAFTKTCSTAAPANWSTASPAPTAKSAGCTKAARSSAATGPPRAPRRHYHRHYRAETHREDDQAAKRKATGHPRKHQQQHLRHRHPVPLPVVQLQPPGRHAAGLPPARVGGHGRE
jgi:hypothetical protein